MTIDKALQHLWLKEEKTQTKQYKRNKKNERKGDENKLFG